jgi:hypothetical protein
MNHIEKNSMTPLKYPQIVLPMSSTETYQKSTMSLKRLKIVSIVEQCDFSMRGLHFAVEKEELVYSFRKFLKS